MFSSKQTVAWFMNCVHKKLVFQFIGKKDNVAATTSRKINIELKHVAFHKSKLEN